MKLPPVSPCFPAQRSGHPRVWITRLSGRATFHTSLTPRLQTCGFTVRRLNSSARAPARCPCVPSHSTVARARISIPGSYAAVGPPSRSRPLSPVTMPRTAPSSTSSVCAAVSGSTIAPSSSACSARWRPSCASEKIQLPLLWKGGGVGSRTAYPGRMR